MINFENRILIFIFYFSNFNLLNSNLNLKIIFENKSLQKNNNLFFKILKFFKE
jgi:hypothetical protein